MITSDMEMESGAKAAVEYRRFHTRLSRQAFLVVVVLGLLFFVLGFKNVGRGLVLGGLFSIANFIVMAHLLPLQIGLQKKKTTVVAFASFTGRLFFLAFPIVVGFESDRFNVVSVIIGLFAVQFFIFLDRLVLIRFKKA
ncbi:MAG: ATP synthase subunit I [Deltaproteobacteria bacterium]|nr:ATP synthase subunit I [Deltaproteobacteria bacterium]MBW2068026.1 ATP synthase subunit I [Deltaproteobacteria bacterium]